MEGYIKQGDCLDLLKQVPSDSAAAVITSPPYNMNLRVSKGRYLSRCNNRNHRQEFATKYQNYDDDLSVEAYFDFQKSVISEALRVSPLLFYNIQMITGNKVALMKLLGYFSEVVKDIIVWDKTRAQPAMKYNTLNSQWEFIIVFDREKPYNRMFDTCNFARGTESNLWSIPTKRSAEGFKAAFPLELPTRIIEDFTDPGSIILDPFMGSGTTGVAAARTGRGFIGFELDPGTFEIAKKRIEEAEADAWLL